MPIRFIIDILGIGVLFWSVARILHHIALRNADSSKTNKSSRTLYYLAIVFYLLGTFTSLIIEVIDGMCHKRLYHIHLAELRKMKAYVTLPNLQKQPFDDFCEEHEVGRYHSEAPLDIPYTWYSFQGICYEKNV